VLSDRPDRRATIIFFRAILKPVNWVFPTFFNIPVSTMAKAILNKTLTPAAEKVEILENKTMHHVAAN